MIYLKNTTDRQVVFIPRPSKEAAFGPLVFKATSTTDHSGFAFETASYETTGLFFKMAVRLDAKTKPGEYRYSLSDPFGVVSTGILVIGETGNPKQYQNKTEYEQYKH